MNRRSTASVVARAVSTLTIGLTVVSFLPGSAQAEPGASASRRVVVSQKPRRPVVRDHRNGNADRDHRTRPAPRPRRPVVVRPKPRKRGVIVRDRRGQVVSRNGRTVVRAKPGRGYGRDHRIVIPPARSRADLDVFAAEMFIRRASNLSCDSLGDLLREISNDILSARTLPPEVIYPGDDREERLRKQYANQLRGFLDKPNFSKMIMERLTMAFEGCDRLCFDDGVAIGVISGTGYCTASVDLDGISSDDGFRFQEALPVCETANFAGCQQGYSQAVGSVPGCLDYATGSFEQTYNEFVSQDCHIEDPNEGEY